MSTAVLQPRTMPDNPYAPNPNLKVWMGNEIVPVAEAKIGVFDHGLLYGDGIFEGIRIYNGKIFKEREHIERLFQSAKVIRLPMPMTFDEISDAMYETMRANNIRGDGYIRLVVTRGVGALGISIRRTANPTVIIITDKISLYPEEVYERGLRCIVSSIQRNHVNTLSPRIKSLNYLNNVLAKVEAHDHGCDEAVMLNTLGYVAECTGDNLFLIRRGELFTPPLTDGFLEGITRGVVMELAIARGWPVLERSLIRHDLYVADECFATGTAAEIVPIVEIDKRPVGDGRPGRMTRLLMEDFVKYRNSA
jgi:branched-chain amino acid aminotransferase